MAKSLVIVGIIAAVEAGALAAIIESSDDWTTFKNLFNKSYVDEREENYRKNVFHENQRMIKRHNEWYDAGEFSYKLKMNQFGDTTYDEYSQSFFDNDETRKQRRYLHTMKYAAYTQNDEIKIPDAVDWREKGAVTPVRDQGLACDSSWAFSAAGALEGQYFKKTGVLEALSVQELIDCTTDYGTNGCHQGHFVFAFQYACDRRRLETEVDNPYEASEKNCSRPKINIGLDDPLLYRKVSNVKDACYVLMKNRDENRVKAAVATVGPMSTGIDISDNTFRFYSEGIYYQLGCRYVVTNHAVLIVGYGIDKENQDFWLVKNSFGKTWGENGYFKIARNRNYACGIAEYAAYPVV